MIETGLIITSKMRKTPSSLSAAVSIMHIIFESDHLKY
jgi:hypothetical protein